MSNKRRNNFRTKYRVKKLNRKKSLKKKNTKRRNYKRKKYTKRRQYKNKNHKSNALVKGGVVYQLGGNPVVLDETTRDFDVVIPAKTHKIIQYCISDKNPYENISIKVSVDQSYHRMTVTEQDIGLDHYSSDSGQFDVSEMSEPPVNRTTNANISIDRETFTNTYIYIYLDNSYSHFNAKKVHLKFGRDIDELANDIINAFEQNNYYGVLGVEMTTNTEEITQKKRELMFEFSQPVYHGDVATGRKVLSHIKEASGYLIDSSQREEYDKDYYNRAIYMKLKEH